MHGATIQISVKPGSKRAGFALEGDTYVLRVRERAVEGAANVACIRALAETIGVAPSRVSLVRGDRARIKVFAVSDMTSDELDARVKAAVR